MTRPAARYDVVGLGSMVVDAIARAPRHVGPDEKVLLDASAPAEGALVQRFVGGVLLNQLGWARVLGLRVALFGKQADDAEGAFLRAGMQAAGIEHHLDLSGRASSFAHIYLDSEGRRSIYMARGATGELTTDDVDAQRALLESTHVVSSEVSQVPLAAVVRALERGKAAGALAALDLDVRLEDAVPALGTRRELERALALADVLKASLAAVPGLIEGTEPAAVAGALRARFGASVVLVTAAEQGSFGALDGGVLQVPAPRAAVIDTTGAGDAFMGGVLAARRRGLDWNDALRLGNACGAACCERVGAFPDDLAAARARVLELYAELGGKPIRITELEAGPGALSGRDPVDHLLSTATGALKRVASRLDRNALRLVVERVRASEAEGGRVHVTGIGKSEYVAGYTAALLSSTGTPAFFLHGTEATHGSLGQLRPGDVLIAISNSGRTPELLATVHAARGIGVRLIAISGALESPLAEASELVLEAGVEDEGGPLGLAPRASVLAQLLVAVALSVALQPEEFDRRDYHRLHPGGDLGRRSRL